jgi:hypothetical protein
MTARTFMGPISRFFRKLLAQALAIQHLLCDTAR